MLQIKNLTITHLKDLRTIIKDFSLILNEGDKAAIIGEEGNGKSTLLQLIYDEKLVEGYIEYTGEILNNAEDHSGSDDVVITGYLDNSNSTHLCEIAIFNFGKTIAETFREMPN